jgi:hypothetical protein
LPEVNDSILDNTKKMIGFEADDTGFDLDIITHINSVFFDLTQLGVGPDEGFSIVDNTAKWTEYFGENKIDAVKSYMYLRVRLLFDPPSTSFAIDAMNKQVEKFEWRLHVHMEGVRHPWVDPESLITTE